MGYSAHEFGVMIADNTRMGAYAEAIARAVRPGDVVIDIGAGTGIFSFLACRAGARKVYAIEPNDAHFLGRELTRNNGFAGRIEWIPRLSTNVTLPEKADVIVADLRGVLPYFNCSIRSLADARDRLLKEGGTLIPRRDVLWATLCSDSTSYAQCVQPWADNHFDLQLEPYSTHLAGGVYKCHPKAEKMLSEPIRWAEIDYHTAQSTDAGNRLAFTVNRDATGHGIMVWFDATLHEDIGFTGGPGAPEMVYGCALLPWPKPVALRQGDQVNVHLSVRMVADDYVWLWNTEFGKDAAGGRFRQSTATNQLFPPNALRDASPDQVPQLAPRGRMLLCALRSIERGDTISATAAELATSYPDEFKSEQQARDFLAESVLAFTGTDGGGN